MTSFKSPHHLIVHRCSAAVALAFLSLPGLAQTAAAPVGTAADDANTSTLESIQVSADWLGSGLQNSVKRFPGARTVVKKEEIENSGASNIGDVMRRIPGVQSTDNSGTAAARSRSISACAD